LSSSKENEIPGERREHGQRLGMFLIVLVFSLAFAAAVAFLFVYWTSRETMLLGGTIAIALGGVGAGLVIWAHRLMRYEEASGPREVLSSDLSERQALLEDFVAGQHQIERRRILGWMTGVVLGTLGVGVLSLLRSLGKSPLPVLLKPTWVNGERLVTEDGQPVPVDTLQPGDIITVFPEGRVGSVASQTLLIRVEEQLLRLPKGRSDWAPKGNVAYSRVCTHAGCSVALYEHREHLLLCPCHQSTFNVLETATPTSGPAARPLPQLPLYVDRDGYLRAAGDFTEPPGPGFWGIPS
jgi:ubiquinol-cytochrome c reductase iron-sulfur subunit